MVNYLLLLAGVPTQLPLAAENDNESHESGHPEKHGLQAVPVKSFLHYL
ncbi:MAG: hypothetical protein VKJ05_04885 [Synechococcaceae cyanobacterium]|nr:hypothetical protein [Synechococcaceae cyanobacterium]